MNLKTSIISQRIWKFPKSKHRIQIYWAIEIGNVHRSIDKTASGQRFDPLYGN